MAFRTVGVLRRARRRAGGLKGFGLRNLTNPLSSLKFFRKEYGILGVLLWLFGSRDVWQMQLRVLHHTSSNDAVSFKESIQNESSVIAVAGTILAQIAITALSLDGLSQTHWITRAFFAFSLVSSIIAVYYATKQYRILGRCLSPEQVRSWIENSQRSDDNDVIAMPSVASVITVSAPNMLLSLSLNSFLVGLGMFLGFTWTRNLDEASGVSGSRAVFVTYIVGLLICYEVYGLSALIVDDVIYVNEEDLLDDMRARSRELKLRAKLELHRKQHTSPAQEPARNIDKEPSSTAEVGRQPPHEIPAKHSVSPEDPSRQKLFEAFQESAALHRSLAKADERLAHLLEKFEAHPMRGVQSPT